MDHERYEECSSTNGADKDHDGSTTTSGLTAEELLSKGRTTDKLIPISFTIAPQIVPIGGTVTIESTEPP